MPRPQEVTLTVVVALIDGRVEALARCLEALHRQTGAPSMEIIVPYDDPCAAVVELGRSYPDVRFIHAKHLDTAAARRGGSREHHDTLRTIGLREARSRYVALTEDHAVQEEGWARGLVDALDAHAGVAAIGGAVECGGDRLLQLAVYYCDFGRYQNPLPEGPAAFVSDSNVVYRREALESVGDVWADDYHETAVHWALVERGHEIWLTPRVQVWQTRTGLTFREAMRERVVWGRSFAGTRVRGAAVGKRLLLAALSPLLPFLMTARLARGVVQRGRGVGRFAAALPLVFALQCAWAFGELLGYATGRPD